MLRTPSMRDEVNKVNWGSIAVLGILIDGL